MTNESERGLTETQPRGLSSTPGASSQGGPENSNNTSEYGPHLSRCAPAVPVKNEPRWDLAALPLRETKQAAALVSAFKRGYRARRGAVIAPSGRVLSLVRDTRGYLRFNVKFYDGKRRPVLVHQLVALQKFGDLAIRQGVHVRHLNGDQSDNRPENIGIGTHSENMRDMDPAVRKQKALRAARVQRRLSDDQVRAMRLERDSGASLKVLGARYGVSLATVSFACNRITYADVSAIRAALTGEGG